MFFGFIDFGEEFNKAVVGTKVKYRSGPHKVYESYVMETNRHGFLAGASPTGPRHCKVLWHQVIEFEPHIQAMLSPEDIQDINEVAANNDSIIPAMMGEQQCYQTH